MGGRGSGFFLFLFFFFGGGGVREDANVNEDLKLM